MGIKYNRLTLKLGLFSEPFLVPVTQCDLKDAYEDMRQTLGLCKTGAEIRTPIQNQEL